MASKIGLSVFVNGILIVLLLSTMVFSILSDIRKNKLAKMKAHTEELNRIVERQNRNDQGDGSLSYPVECVPYPADGCVCPKIRTEKSDANYTCTAFICFGSCEKQFSLRTAQVLLDEKIIRFDAEDFRRCIDLYPISYGGSGTSTAQTSGK